MLLESFKTQYTGMCILKTFKINYDSRLIKSNGVIIEIPSNYICAWWLIMLLK